MSDWLVFSTEPAAESAVRQIDALVGNPRHGRNAGTGKPEPDKTGTLTWAVPVQRATDARWCFPRCPDVDPARPFDVEPYGPAWFPEEPDQ